MKDWPLRTASNQIRHRSLCIAHLVRHTREVQAGHVATHNNPHSPTIATAVVEKIDYEATYLNCLTSGGPIRAAVPMTLPTDEALFEAVWRALKPESISEVCLLVIDNTLHLEDLWVSETLLEEVSDPQEAALHPGSCDAP